MLYQLFEAVAFVHYVGFRLEKVRHHNSFWQLFPTETHRSAQTLPLLRSQCHIIIGDVTQRPKCLLWSIFMSNYDNALLIWVWALPCLGWNHAEMFVEWRCIQSAAVCFVYTREEQFSRHAIHNVTAHRTRWYTGNTGYDTSPRSCSGNYRLPWYH